MKKVVITGATSMIGFSLVQACIKNNVFVYAIVRKNSCKTTIFSPSPFLTILECELDEINLLPCLITDKIDIFTILVGVTPLKTQEWILFYKMQI